ncbi:Prolyl endopeptidase [Strongyloides ratti]|uniref:Prolyl endopeptidase n=1 Tax=Strongyloides ratti TaxID=34506 RepID=A0A090LN95_STRRB|nr:Prolyl endopeptidase [Strongyloides ratti]CEF71330.1 Prolyl endopeptidase [Strongyloides ratti]
MIEVILTKKEGYCGKIGYNKRYLSTIHINVTEYPYMIKLKNSFDRHHGQKVKDDYRYLEDKYFSITIKFIEELNNISETVFSKSKYRKDITDKFNDLWKYDKFGLYSKYGNYYYYFFYNGSTLLPSLMQSKNLNEKGKTFINFDKLDSKGEIEIKDMVFSNDGKMMAYVIKEKDNAWNTIMFKYTNNKKIKDKLNNVIYSMYNFIFNNKGFIYSTYPEKNGTLGGFMISNFKKHSLYYHHFGQKQTSDKLLATCKDGDDFIIHGTLSNDGKYLFVQCINEISGTNNLYYVKLNNNKYFKKKIKLIPLITRNDALYNVIDSNSKYVYIYTNLNTAFGKVIKMKLIDKYYNQNKWKLFIEETRNQEINKIVPVGKKYLVANCMTNLQSFLIIYDMKNGKYLKKINFGEGIIEDISGSSMHYELFVTFNNLVSPQTIYRLNLEYGIKKIIQKKIIQSIPNDIKDEQFIIKKLHYLGRDHTRIPLIMFYNRKTLRNRKNPIILEGFGGFKSTLRPNYALSKLLFVKHFGGIWCIAGIRGGGEYGTKWHLNGKGLNKKNSFFDFIAGAEFIIKRRYTRPSKLAIFGSSVGGLIANVVSQMRPDLLGAVVSKTPLLDMIRYHRLTTHDEIFIEEFGDVSIKKHFKNLIKYSPLHNLKLPKHKLQWPSTLLFTTTEDVIVGPEHTLKYLARLYVLLQKAIKYQTNPVIGFVGKYYGHHDYQKPEEKLLNESINMFCFLQQTLDLKWYK